MKSIKRLLFFLLLFSSGNLMAQQLIVKKTETQATCNNNDGGVTLDVSGGIPPYSYEWRTTLYQTGTLFSTASSVSNLAKGLYNLKVTDAANNQYSDSIIVTNGINAYVYSSTYAQCPLHNGVVTAEVSGGTQPYTYLWSNGSTTNSASNLAGGSTVKVQIHDANGCNVFFNAYSSQAYNSDIYEALVGETSSITSNYTTTPEQCPLNNGTITIHASGGKAPYSYYWNTTPVKNTQTITGLTNGYYTATITDADGCKQLVYPYVSLNAGSLSVSGTKTNDNCSRNTGTASISISGGVPPYSVKWPDGSSLLSRTDLGYGFYNVSVTDQNSCTFILTVFIDDISPVNAVISCSETDCDNASGSTIVSVFGGNAPYTYQWSNGNTTSSMNHLPLGYYSVQVKDANGCKAQAWTYVNIKNSCFGNISGIVYQDNNGNCLQDVGDYPISNRWVSMQAAVSTPVLYDSYSLTSSNGQYSMRYILPDMYTIDFEDAIRTAACPATGKYAINIPTSAATYPNKDFAMVPNDLYEDVSVQSYYGSILSEPRPGFNFSYSFGYNNMGTVPTDGFVEIIYGDLETFVSSSPAADFYDPLTKTLRFNYSNLMIGNIKSIQLTFNLPPTVLLGSSFSHTITANVSGTDATPANNVREQFFTVVGSFDPNDLKVTPPDKIVEEDSILSYAIRFQNTGTYYAEIVVIKDTLDENVDITSITDIVASHDYKFRVLENRIIEFAFENIFLPDSNRNEPGSHGFVNYRIRKNKKLLPGTQIKNKASIYFDYNQPVNTNRTVNTMTMATTGITGKSQVNTGKVYPNPATDFTCFSFDKEISSLQLVTVSGQTVLNQTVSRQKNFSIQLNQSKGMYFYKAICTDGNSYEGKLVIE